MWISQEWVPCPTWILNWHANIVRLDLSSPTCVLVWYACITMLGPRSDVCLSSYMSIVRLGPMFGRHVGVRLACKFTRV